ncbi:unnamed protein product, partial [Ectocarpus sp. 12 AP-2014]
MKVPSDYSRFADVAREPLNRAQRCCCSCTAVSPGHAYSPSPVREHASTRDKHPAGTLRHSLTHSLTFWSKKSQEQAIRIAIPAHPENHFTFPCRKRRNTSA